jgi:hypothetical protein
VNHPIPARLLAYARYRIDFGKEVEQHIEVCRECAHVVGNALSEEIDRRRGDVLGRLRKTGTKT